jgi:transposase-like protein
VAELPNFTWRIAKAQGKSVRPGLYYCAACNDQFTVTVGTVMERSKISISKWLFAMHLRGPFRCQVYNCALSRIRFLAGSTIDTPR